MGAAEVLEALGWSRVELEVGYGLDGAELGGNDPSNSGEGRRAE